MNAAFQNIGFNAVRVPEMVSRGDFDVAIAVMGMLGIVMFIASIVIGLVVHGNRSEQLEKKVDTLKTDNVNLQEKVRTLTAQVAVLTDSNLETVADIKSLKNPLPTDPFWSQSVATKTEVPKIDPTPFPVMNNSGTFPSFPVTSTNTVPKVEVRNLPIHSEVVLPPVHISEMPRLFNEVYPPNVSYPACKQPTRNNV